MAYDGYTLIDVQRDGPLVTATVNNPPINLITMALFGELARLAERFRPRVKEKIPSENGRRAFWEGIFDGPVAELVYSDR